MRSPIPNSIRFSTEVPAKAPYFELSIKDAIALFSDGGIRSPDEQALEGMRAHLRERRDVKAAAFRPGFRPGAWRPRCDFCSLEPVDVAACVEASLFGVKADHALQRIRDLPDDPALFFEGNHEAAFAATDRIYVWPAGEVTPEVLKDDHADHRTIF
jgi:hypothetical protein